ncbi:CoxG family protein [Alicyclobacillus fastidiosus]|uniref:Carbon monoxide dehydrogenase subunit G n=1 Tax=Alicyclobacillus fastidiosus TaxID=392011 RepID=A0ABV5ABY7_9BACL|nr:carbon monoxide dehydrogenase subunit G [Alicyclobacillus fastidiosus]WEH10319.1 carbon monoxide dehydrogenase subunit G [Alicyclobacillus fastidiosus]
MQINGTKTVQLTQDQTYQLLTDPAVLTRAIPGVKQLTEISKHRYEADLEIGVAGIKGRYKGDIRMTDVIEGQAFRLRITGEGPMGFLEADVRISLQAQTSGTLISYAGDATVGGTVAGVGQRVLSGVAKLLIGQFFNGIVKESASVRFS